MRRSLILFWGNDDAERWTMVGSCGMGAAGT
jgi:hypothetical protein